MEETMKLEKLKEGMEKKVKSIMEHYQDDFYIHDMARIEQVVENNEKQFLWFVHTCGTHLMDSIDTDGGKQYIKIIQKARGHYIDSGRGKLFLCNLERGTIRKVSFDQYI